MLRNTNNSKQAKNQISTKVFAPLQEISNSIYSMMKRIGKLENKQIDDPDYLSLLFKIKTQAFCLQGVSNDKMIGNSEQYLSLLRYFENLSRETRSKPLVRHCALEIIK